MKTFSFISDGDNPVTVVAQYEDGVATFGVARCGNYDNFSKELGIQIATDRVTKQPWQSIDGLSRFGQSSFEVIARGIVNHISRQKQPSIKLVRRIRANSASAIPVAQAV
jgi:hypothetical protein